MFASPAVPFLVLLSVFIITENPLAVKGFLKSFFIFLLAIHTSVKALFGNGVVRKVYGANIVEPVVDAGPAVAGAEQMVDGVVGVGPEIVGIHCFYLPFFFLT